MWEYIGKAKDIFWAATTAVAVVGAIGSGVWAFWLQPALAAEAETQIKLKVDERIETLEGGVGRLKLKTNETNMAVKEIQLEQRSLAKDIDRTNQLLNQLLIRLQAAPVAQP